MNRGTLIGRPEAENRGENVLGMKEMASERISL
jgi:hypothetical protein